jgi:putative N6-adenine-specific DNA methylase
MSEQILSLTARTFFGLEAILAKELEEIGATEIAVSKRAVTFQGSLETLYRANLCLRTALKVILPIHQFNAMNEQELYDGVKSIDWSKYLEANGSFMVETAVQSEHFSHSKYVAYKAKDAIVDQFREKFGSRPSVDLESPNLYIDVRISSDIVVVSLNSSGEPLYKRGYRSEQNEAPLNEALAAGMIMSTGWHGERDLVDTMCGSGTIPIEAAMIASHMAPNLLREDFAFKSWNDFDPKLLLEIKKELRAKIVSPSCKIHGYDINANTVAAAMIHAENAKVDDRIVLKTKDMFNSAAPFPGGLLIFNPPYQLRLRTENIEDFYKQIGDALKKNYAGYEAWLLSANFIAMKNIGLKTSAKVILYNGPLECRFIKFELYEGSKRQTNEHQTA